MFGLFLLCKRVFGFDVEVFAENPGTLFLDRTNATSSTPNWTEVFIFLWPTSVFDMLWDCGESAPGERTLPPSGGEWNTYQTTTTSTHTLVYSKESCPLSCKWKLL